MNKILVRMILKIGFHPSSISSNDWAIIDRVSPRFADLCLTCHSSPSSPLQSSFSSWALFLLFFRWCFLLNFSQLFQFHRNFSIMSFSVNRLIFITLAFNSLSLSLSLCHSSFSLFQRHFLLEWRETSSRPFNTFCSFFSKPVFPFEIYILTYIRSVLCPQSVLWFYYPCWSWYPMVSITATAHMDQPSITGLDIQPLPTHPTHILHRMSSHRIQ